MVREQFIMRICVYNDVEGKWCNNWHMTTDVLDCVGCRDKSLGYKVKEEHNAETNSNTT